jgi:hypothetical protein
MGDENKCASRRKQLKRSAKQNEKQIKGYSTHTLTNRVEEEKEARGKDCRKKERKKERRNDGNCRKFGHTEHFYFHIK